MRNPNGVRDHFYETCHKPGHVHGCPGRAGGDHEFELSYAEMWAWHEAIAKTIHERAGDDDPHRFGRESADCDWLADQIIEATGGHRLLPVTVQ